jgi:hypothetical protein
VPVQEQLKPLLMLQAVVHSRMSEQQVWVPLSDWSLTDQQVSNDRYAYLSLLAQVMSFNRTPIRNLSHLSVMVARCSDEFMRFDLDFGEVSCT